MKLDANTAKIKLRIIILGVCNLLMLFAIAAFLMGLQEEPIPVVISIVVVLPFIGMFISMISRDLNDLKNPNGIVEITSEGFIDRRTMKKVLPWNNLEWNKKTVKGRTSIMFRILKDEDRYMKKMNFTDRMNFTFAKPLRMKPYYVDLFSLSKTTKEIIAEFENYKAPK